MQKSANMEYPVSELISQRRSVRAFSSKSIAQEKIHSLFEATRWAPSSTNEQPWLYLYATREQTELWGKLFDCLNAGNQVWAKDAPLLVFSMARFKGLNAYALYDLGGANSFLAIQAVELGLQARQMAGYHLTKVMEHLTVPPSYELGVFIAIGYPADTNDIPDSLRQREDSPRERFLQQEFVMNKSF